MYRTLTKRTYLMIVGLITLPLMIFFYIEATWQYEKLIKDKEQELLGVAYSIRRSIPLDFSDTLAAVNSQSLSRDEKAFLLNKVLQPIVEEHTKVYSGFGIGVYSRSIERVIAIAPNYRLDKLAQVTNPGYLRSYETGKPELIKIDRSSDWDGKPILNLTYPIYDGHEIIGHTWASVKVESVTNHLYQKIISGCLLAIIIWLAIVVVIRWTFHRIDRALADLAEQIRNEDDSRARFVEVPQLLPVLDTIINMRDRLKEKTNMLNWVLNHIPGGILAIDKDKKIIYANPQAHQLLLQQDSLINRDYSNMEHVFYNGEGRERLVLLEALEEGLVCTRKRIVHDGTILQFNAAPILDGAGEIAAAAAYFRDMTEEEARDRQRHDFFQKLNYLVNGLPLGVLMVNGSGVIEALNMSFARICLSGDHSDFIGRHYKDLVRITTSEYDYIEIKRALEGKETVQLRCYVAGKQLLINAYPLADPEGINSGAVGIYHDITGYEDMRNEVTRLDRLNLVGQMAASVAHEVRNPMTVARGYVEFLCRKSDKYKEQMQVIITELDRANSIITNFLSLARGYSTVAELEDVNDIIKEIIPLIESEALAKNHEFSCRLSESTHMCLVNKEEIKQVILNLAKNGLEAMKNRKKGTLLIETELEGDNFLLRVTDDGCGIPANLVEKIFEPFYTSKEEGTGLGLAVCRNIVEKALGIISVSSTEGKGTSFTICIPVIKERSDY